MLFPIRGTALILLLAVSRFAARSAGARPAVHLSLFARCRRALRNFVGRSAA